MKKLVSLVLVLALAFTAASVAFADEMSAEDLSKLLAGDDSLVDLIDEARVEGELVVYGSCEEPYVAAAANHFAEITGLKVSYQRLSTGEVQGKIAEENHNPSADVWFGGTTDPTTRAPRTAS